MGRKPTPQPLKLATSNNLVHDTNNPHTLMGVTPRAVTSSASQPYFPQHSAPLPNRPQTSASPARNPHANQYHQSESQPQSARDAAPSYPSISGALDSSALPIQSNTTQADARKSTRSGLFGFKSRSASQDPLPPVGRFIDQTETSMSKEGEESGHTRQTPSKC